MFEFGRCVVHFAVDDSEVRMCTALTGKGSWFLPFNKGYNDGAGNPPNPHGIKTDYLWKEVLTPVGLTNILENYAQIIEEKDPLTGRKKRKQVWPRYHQLGLVRQALADVRDHGAGNQLDFGTQMAGDRRRLPCSRYLSDWPGRRAELRDFLSLRFLGPNNPFQNLPSLAAFNRDITPLGRHVKGTMLECVPRGVTTRTAQVVTPGGTMSGDVNNKCILSLDYCLAGLAISCPICAFSCWISACCDCI
jgi:hypothetical protein